MKTCCACNLDKPLEAFPPRKLSKDGFNHRCKTCLKTYRLQYYRDNKKFVVRSVQKRKRTTQDWLLEYKIGLVCAECPESHPAALDFHHKDKTLKNFSISQASSQGISKERILEEISKCIVLCANCHRKLHWDEKHADMV